MLCGQARGFTKKINEEEDYEENINEYIFVYKRNG